VPLGDMAISVERESSVVEVEEAAVAVREK
jgi:hypothetical protein